MKTLSIGTQSRESMIDITAKVQAIASEFNHTSGAVFIFCPHTTCALTINEGADPDVRKDMVRFFSETIPYKNNWLHSEGNSDAHIKSSFLGSSLLVPLENGRLRLGTWQAIYLYDGDGPRTRSIWISLLQEAD